MGLFDRFRREALLVETGRAGITPVSPWSDRSTLARIVLDDLHGVRPTTYGRQDAQRVPALARARAVICGTLSRQPLAQFTDGVRDVAQPTWISTSSSRQSPRTRMLWTLDDVFHYGLSLWAVRRDGETIADAVRVSRDAWHLDDAGRVVVTTADGERVAADHEVILFEGPQEGICSLAADGIRAAADMRAAWTKRVESPAPLVELHNTDQNMYLEDHEIAKLVGDWEAARRQGGTAYTPSGIQTNVHGSTPTDLFVAGRNAERLDFANWTNLAASVLDGSLSTASLTYTTEKGDRSELVDISLAYWANPIEARLSLDDVTPPGSRVAFDLQYMTLPAADNHPSGPTFED